MSFVDVVALEQRRAERYNHYFVVVLMDPMKVSLPDLLRTAAKSLRASDVLGAVDPYGRFHWDWICEGRRSQESPSAEWSEKGLLGAILPETDGRGADLALRRITGKLGTDEVVSARYAVYPDDSTDPAELVAIASAAA